MYVFPVPIAIPGCHPRSLSGQEGNRQQAKVSAVRWLEFV